MPDLPGQASSRPPYSSLTIAATCCQRASRALPFCYALSAPASSPTAAASVPDPVQVSAFARDLTCFVWSVAGPAWTDSCGASCDLHCVFRNQSTASEHNEWLSSPSLGGPTSAATSAAAAAAASTPGAAQCIRQPAAGLQLL